MRDPVTARRSGLSCPGPVSGAATITRARIAPLAPRRYLRRMRVLQTSHTRHFDLLMLCARIGYSPPRSVA